MFCHRRFDFDVSREFDPKRLRWRRADGVKGAGWNLGYADLSGFSRAEAQRVLQLESEIVRRIEASDDPAAELLAIEDELYEEFDDALYGLDLGVAAAVAALSVVGCVPISSCNGGSFGDSHREQYPLVAMFASQSAIPAIKAAAQMADTGLENGQDGMLVVYANDIRKMMKFGSYLLDVPT